MPEKTLRPPQSERLTAAYDVRELHKYFAKALEALNNVILSPELLTPPAVEPVARWIQLIADVKKRATHSGVHYVRHNLAATSEQVVLFVIEQAVSFAEIAPGVAEHLKSLASESGDPLQAVHGAGLNEALHSGSKASGDATRLILQQWLAGSAPAKLGNRPSAMDLLRFSFAAKANVDKALWHSLEARRWGTLVTEHRRQSLGRTTPVDNCAQAANAAFLIQKYFHHWHKAKTYASPLMPLVEYTSYYGAEWMKEWKVAGGVDDKTGLRNLDKVFAFINQPTAAHAGCEALGVCYGPSKSNPAKAALELGFFAGTEAIQAPVIAVFPWYLDAAIWLGNKWDAVGALKDKVKAGLSSAGHGIETAWEEYVTPVIDDALDRSPTAAAARDGEDPLSIIYELQSRIERFEKMVMRGKASPKFTFTDRFIKYCLEKLVTGQHGDAAHAAKPPIAEIFVTGSKAPAATPIANPDRETTAYAGKAQHHPGNQNQAPESGGDGTPKGADRRNQADFGVNAPQFPLRPLPEHGPSGDASADARTGRLYYDVYSLVESDDDSQLLKAMKKWWSARRKSDIAIALAFVAAGVAITLTAGAALPVVAMIGIAAARAVAKKATQKANQKLQFAYNKKDLADANKGADEKLTLSVANLKDTVESLARHFVSACKNYERLQELKKQLKAQGDEFKSCNQAASYAYAAFAFEHHFDKVLAQSQHLGACAELMLQLLEDGEKFFEDGNAEGFSKEFKAIDAWVATDAEKHMEACDGLKKGKAKITSSRAAPAYISQNLPSCVCYRRHVNANRGRFAEDAPQRGLFYGDYIDAPVSGDGPFTMKEHWLQQLNLLVEKIQAEQKKRVDEEKAAIKAGEQARAG